MESIDDINKSIWTQHWRLSILFSGISAVMVLFAYFKVPENTGSAISRFGHNLSFYLPMIIASIIFGLIGFIFYMSSKTGFEGLSKRVRKIRKTIPLILLIPISLHLLVIIINIGIALIIK